MTYEERIVKLCKECPEREQCGYVPRKLMGDCTYLQYVMNGWELGYQDAVEKAAEYMRNHIDQQLIIYHEQTWKKRDAFIDGFKKYMED